MAYALNEVTIRTNNTEAGLKQIEEIWSDITSGKLPVLFDSEHQFRQGISPISKYSNYASDETGDYDLSILAVTSDFFRQMEREAGEGRYKKYDVSDDGGDINACAKKAWEMVWNEQKTGQIKRAFSADYESTVPAGYTKDNKAHCYLYIALCA